MPLRRWFVSCSPEWQLSAEDIPRDDLENHLRALASDSAADRDKAEEALLTGGKAAVELLAPAATRGALEERFRATRILGRLANSHNDAAASAREALRTIAAQGDGPVSKQAKDELAPWLRLDEMQRLAAVFAMYFVYVLVSESMGKRYIGQSENLARRLREHNTPAHNLATSTSRQRGPWRLVLFELFDSRQETKKGREVIVIDSHPFSII